MTGRLIAALAVLTLATAVSIAGWATVGFVAWKLRRGGHR